MAQYDHITEQQLTTFVDQVRGATGSEQAILIVINSSAPGEWQSSCVASVGAGAKEGPYRMAMSLLRTAQAMLQRADPSVRVKVQTPDGLHDLPEHDIGRFEVRPQ